MSSGSLLAANFVLALAAAAAAQSPLPELRTEATDGGSIFHVRNTGSQPLTGYLIELVDYPGSFYMLWVDELTAGGQALPPGGQKTIRVSNMIVGAVPDYVKLMAAVYADGSSAGTPERVKQLLDRRRALLETTRELIRRIEKAGAPGAAQLKQWEDSILAPARSNRTTQEAINQAARKALIGETAAHLQAGTAEQTLAGLRASERALAASQPGL